MTSSCADIVLIASSKWEMTKPSLLHEGQDKFSGDSGTKYWLDV